MPPPASPDVPPTALDAPAPETVAPTPVDVESRGLFVRRLLCWCLPALLVGLALRAALMGSMPYGYVQYDSADYLITAEAFIAEHHFHIHDKRSFLTPLLFSAAFLLPAPATITIAVVQHLMGLVATVFVGALVRMWFRFWKPVIIPVTVLFAANPFIIWYEHTIMGEASYLFFTVVMVLAGTLLAARPSTRRLSGFLVSLVLVFGTRLEAKTFLLFAVLLIGLIFWKQWRRTALALAGVVLAYVGAFHFSGDRDGSSLVYASLIHFAPSVSLATPDFMARIIPLQERARKESPDYPANLVRISKDINHAVADYTAERVKSRRQQRDEEARIVRHLCLETLEAQPVKTLLNPWIKFHLAIDAWTAYCFDDRALWENQRDSYLAKDWMTTVLGRGLTGQPQTLEQIPTWVKDHYDPRRVVWFTDYQRNWFKVPLHFRFPDRPMNSVRWVHDFYGGVNDWRHTLPGIPYFYLLSFLGMLFAALRPSAFRSVHFAWVPTILGGLYLCSMVGVTNGRFRFIYEPFFLIYFFLLFDNLADQIRSRRPTEKKSA